MQAALILVSFVALVFGAVALYYRSSTAKPMTDSEKQHAYELQIQDMSNQLDKEREAHAAELARQTERMRADAIREYDKLKTEAFNAVEQMRFEFERKEAEKDLQRAQTVREDRRQSNARSRSALVAKIGEHMAPLLSGFPYNLKDARHVGEIFDFLIFDGLEDGEIQQVVFLEVKTRRGGRVSNQREKMLRDAIRMGRVSYEVYTPELNKDALAEAMEDTRDADNEANESNDDA